VKPKQVDCIFGGCWDAEELALFTRALDAIQRPIVLSLSPGFVPGSPTPPGLPKGGVPEAVATAGALGAAMARLTGDFWDAWEGASGLKTHFAQCADLANAAVGNTSGADGVPFFDLDMLPLGRVGSELPNPVEPFPGKARQSRFTHAEAVSVMSLWIIVRSPLIYGGSMPDTPDSTLDLLRAHDALNVQSRTADQHASPVHTSADNATVVWRVAANATTAELAAGATRAWVIAPFNLGDRKRTLRLSTAELLPDGVKCEHVPTLTPLWGAASKGVSVVTVTAKGVNIDLEPHGGDLISVAC
jgi:hypothetical protein